MRLLLPVLLISSFSVLAQAGEPALPEGLEEFESPSLDEPALPEGLADDSAASDEAELPGGIERGNKIPTSAQEPELPEGLGEETLVEEGFEAGSDKEGFADLSGFWEVRLGTRTQDDRFEDDRSITETRLQFDLEHTLGLFNLHLVSDLVYDDLADTHEIKLETGQGWIDLREANLSFTPTSFMDVKIGRQILTWGTGDLLFINDLFPKDWQAFFIGRDVEYLKAPSDAFKLAFFSGVMNLDLVYTPRFDTDRFINGSRISYFSPLAGGIAGQNSVIDAVNPDNTFTDDELAIRLYRNFGAIETAFYAYNGFWKSPGGFDPLTGKAVFPDLRVYGASLRSPVGKGIANLEIGYYDSRMDRNGTNPFINNSEFRLLIGYEREIAKELTMGLQYYLERISDYSAYEASLPSGFPTRDHNRHLFTLRLTKLTHNQNVIWSVFAYASPSDKDFYLRPHVTYKIDDHWTMEAGGNIFGGEREYTFFGQFQENTNLYAAIRYSF